jgi:hypothetical protein
MGQQSLVEVIQLNLLKLREREREREDQIGDEKRRDRHRRRRRRTARPSRRLSLSPAEPPAGIFVVRTVRCWCCSDPLPHWDPGQMTRPPPYFPIPSLSDKLSVWNWLTPELGKERRAEGERSVTNPIKLTHVSRVVKHITKEGDDVVRFSRSTQKKRFRWNEKKLRRCRGSNPGHPRDRREYLPLYYHDSVD